MKAWHSSGYQGVDVLELLHGDCLELMKEIPDGSVDLCLTDPPYGTTACKWDSVIPFGPMWEQLHRACKKNAAMVLFGAEHFSSALRMSNIKNYKYDWVWEKDKATGFLNAKKQPLRSVETISCFYKKQCIYNPQMRLGFKPYTIKQGGHGSNYGKKTRPVVSKSDGERYPINILRFATARNPIHPTQKPVELCEYLIKTYTNKGDTVLDFTMGSGTTGVACVNLNRKFIGIEKDDKYFEIAKDRIKNHSVQLEIA